MKIRKRFLAVFITRFGILLLLYAVILGVPLWLGVKSGLWAIALAFVGVLATAAPFTYNRLCLKAERLIFQKEKVNLIQKEQVRRQIAMDHFSASLAHEIDNPIYAVKGMAEVIRLNVLEDLKTYIPEDKKGILQDRLQRLINDVRRISKMVKAVREFSGQDKGEFIVLLLDDVIASFVDIIEPQFKYEGILFRKSLEAGIKVKGNKIQLEEVLVNFALNSIHALKYSGKQEKVVELKVYLKDGKSVIEFKDNGYGIRKELLEDIFLDFVTTKASTEGMGMGLARVRKIVKNHGGRVWAESDGINLGATFYVELPVLPEVVK